MVSYTDKEVWFWKRYKLHAGRHQWPLIFKPELDLCRAHRRVVEVAVDRERPPRGTMAAG
jgi:hypothetical protein